MNIKKEGEKMNYGEFGGQYVPQELKEKLDIIEKELLAEIQQRIFGIAVAGDEAGIQPGPTEEFDVTVEEDAVEPRPVPSVADMSRAGKEIPPLACIRVGVDASGGPGSRGPGSGIGIECVVFGVEEQSSGAGDFGIPELIDLCLLVKSNTGRILMSAEIVLMHPVMQMSDIHHVLGRRRAFQNGLPVFRSQYIIMHVVRFRRRRDILGFDPVVGIDQMDPGHGPAGIADETAVVVGFSGEIHLIGNDDVPVVDRIIQISASDLTDIPLTGGPLGALPGFVQRRQQHPRQNGNDGDHHEELDQREIPGLAANPMLIAEN